jgi:hypothetical protein
VSGFCDLIDTGPLNIDGALHYFVSLPLISGRKLSGFIFLGFEKDKSLSSQELEFLEVFSMHAGLAFLK